MLTYRLGNCGMVGLSESRILVELAIVLRILRCGNYEIVHGILDKAEMRPTLARDFFEVTDDLL